MVDPVFYTKSLLSLFIEWLYGSESKLLMTESRTFSCPEESNNPSYNHGNQILRNIGSNPQMEPLYISGALPCWADHFLSESCSRKQTLNKVRTSYLLVQCHVPVSLIKKDVGLFTITPWTPQLSLWIIGSCKNIWSLFWLLIPTMQCQSVCVLKPDKSLWGENPFPLFPLLKAKRLTMMNLYPKWDAKCLILKLQCIFV